MIWKWYKKAAHLDRDAAASEEQALRDVTHQTLLSEQ
jgi:hypothetical protein